MSLVVSEKASLANDDKPQTASKGSRAGDASSNVIQAAKGAQPVGENDKDNDNEKCAVDTQPKGSLGPPSQPPSIGSTSNKSTSKVQEHKVNASTDESQKETTTLSSASARRPSTTSRFKEKRPEPLKLNSNQEIPLDLSVKSAGNVPSGNIFNLALINNLMGPLETPRIQWQDNDALLTSAKSRMFSSSTNASQRARLSSLIGDSPPITPSTPLDMMFSSTGAPSSIRPSGSEIGHSALHAIDSPLHSFMISPFDLNKLRTPLVNHHQMRAGETKGTPRRSSSTDNLSARNTNNRTLTVTRDGSSGSNSKKQNSVSPLATKSLSNQFSITNGSAATTKFSYSNQQIATSKIDAQRSPSSSSNSSINGVGGKSLTPTSVANATANLLNIHLNSPSGHSSQSPVNEMFDGGVHQQQNPYKSNNFPEPSPLDPLLSAVSYCQQQQQQRSPFSNFPSTSNSADLFNQHQSGLNSLGSSATLNTPTLISPSQLKAGHMCFLPSPTLSPMSSVFELPSPFMMFPPPSTSTHSLQHHQRVGSTSVPITPGASNNKSPRGVEPRTDASVTILLQTKTANANQNQQSDTLGAPANCATARRVSSENDLPDRPRIGPSANVLQQLITTAAQKSQSNDSNNIDNEDTIEDVNMDIDGHDVNCDLDDGDLSKTSERPATVIPQICVSNHHLSNHQSKRVDSNARTSANRALSPLSGSRWARASEQLGEERHESSSAPPGVYEPRAKSKLKIVGADSCCNLTRNKSETTTRHDNLLGGEGRLQDKPTSLSHSDINQSFIQRDRSLSKPYPVIRRLVAATSQQIQQPSDGSNGYSSSFHETIRSNSAEPAVFQRNSGASRASQQMCSSPNGASCQLYTRQNISDSAQHLTNATKAGSQFASNLFPQQHQHHQQPLPRQQVGHFLTNQQSQCHYQSQSLVYDQQQYYNQHPQTSVQQRGEFSYGHQQQHNSISANDLHRPQNNRHAAEYSPVVSSHMIAAAAANGNNVNANNRPIQPQQHFFQQNLSSIPLSPMNRFDTLPSSYNGYQQHFAQQQQQQQQNISNNTSATSVSLLRMAERQTSSHLLPNESMMRRTTMSSSRGEQVASFASDNAMTHCAGYPIESESRSESRSSCSLDFTNSFNSGRLDHSGSSNLVSKKYHCDHCSKSFTRSDMLTRHRRLHSGDRPFQCTECKQEFSRSDHLSTHMRTHTGEKPYKCKLCSYSACRKDMITRHLKVHNRSPHSAEPPT